MATPTDDNQEGQDRSEERKNWAIGCAAILSIIALLMLIGVICGAPDSPRQSSSVGLSRVQAFDY